LRQLIFREEKFRWLDLTVDEALEDFLGLADGINSPMKFFDVERVDDNTMHIKAWISPSYRDLRIEIDVVNSKAKQILRQLRKSGFRGPVEERQSTTLW